MTTEPYIPVWRIVLQRQRKAWFWPRKPYTLRSTGGDTEYWIDNLHFDGEYQQGGVKQLTKTALAHWKHENQPEAFKLSKTPTESPKVAYRESKDVSGESSESEKDKQEDPFEEAP
jgi:hypothetical protein